MAICGYNAISLISFAKQSLISAHNEITSLHLLKRCTVSSIRTKRRCTNLKLEKLKIQI